MPVRTPKELFVMLLSDVRQATEKSATIYQEIGQHVQETQIKEVLEGTFPAVWVSGEISNFSRPHSGHCYLTLKDDQAQMRAVIWRTAAVEASAWGSRSAPGHRRYRGPSRRPSAHCCSKER